MPAHRVVLVHHDASVEVLSMVGFRPNEWLLRTYVGSVVETTKAFHRGDYAVRFCSDDHQEGTLVYAERPVELYWQARDQEMRYRNLHADRVDDMPEEGVRVPVGGGKSPLAILTETRDESATLLGSRAGR